MMSTLTIAIVALFVFGYLLIALESFVKIDKAAIALLMFVLCPRATSEAAAKTCWPV